MGEKNDETFSMVSGRALSHLQEQTHLRLTHLRPWVPNRSIVTEAVLVDRLPLEKLNRLRGRPRELIEN